MYLSSPLLGLLAAGPSVIKAASPSSPASPLLNSLNSLECLIVSIVNQALHTYPSATPFCSSFLHLSTLTTTSTSTVYAPTTSLRSFTEGTVTGTVARSTITKTAATTTITTCTPVVSAASGANNAAKRDIVVPSCVAAFETAQISKACSCLSISNPSTTITSVVTVTPIVSKVTSIYASTNVTPIPTTVTTTPTSFSINCPSTSSSVFSSGSSSSSAASSTSPSTSSSSSVLSPSSATPSSMISSSTTATTSSYSPSQSATGSCGLQGNLNYAGNLISDLTHAGGVNPISPTDCQTICTSVLGCGSFEFNTATNECIGFYNNVASNTFQAQSGSYQFYVYDLTCNLGSPTAVVPTSNTSPIPTATASGAGDCGFQGHLLANEIGQLTHSDGSSPTSPADCQNICAITLGCAVLEFDIATNQCFGFADSFSKDAFATDGATYPFYIYDEGCPLGNNSTSSSTTPSTSPGTMTSLTSSSSTSVMSTSPNTSTTSSSVVSSTSSTSSASCAATGLVYDVFTFPSKVEPFNASIYNNNATNYQFSGTAANINFNPNDNEFSTLPGTSSYGSGQYDTAYKTFVFHGYFQALVNGTYTIQVDAKIDDYGYIWVGQKAYTAWGQSNYDAFGMYIYQNPAPANHTVLITTTAGSLTPITILYANSGGGGLCLFDIITPDGTAYGSTSGFFVQPSCGNGSFNSPPTYYPPSPSTSTSTAPPITSTSSTTITNPTSASTSTSSCTFTTGIPSSSAPCATQLTTPTQVPSVSSQNPNPYNLLGCLKIDAPDGLNPITLAADGSTVQNNMTTEYCADLAGANTYFGLTLGVQCYFGNAFNPAGYPVVPASQCNSICLGNAAESCGAESLLQVYSDNPNDAPLTPTSVVTPGAIVNPAVGTNSTWTYQGCYQYGFNAVNGNTDRHVSVESCANFCEGLAAPAFSLRYGNHCYCGYMETCNTLYCDSECEAPCVGDAAEACGADYFSLVYTLDS